MVGFHNFAVGLHIAKERPFGDTLVTTIRVMMAYITLFHTRLATRIRSRKRQIDILVNMLENVNVSIVIRSSFVIKDICLGDEESISCPKPEFTIATVRPKQAMEDN